MGAYVSHFTLRFGSAQTVGSLHGIKSSTSSGGYKLCTPEGLPVRQVYKDEQGRTFEQDELKKGKLKEDGTIDIVPEEDIKEAKTSRLDKDVLSVTAHERTDVDQFLFPSTLQAYILQPGIKKGSKVVQDTVNTQWYDFISTVVGDSDIVLLGKCNLRNHEGLFRLGLYQGYITIQKQLYPEELNQFPVRDGGLAKPERKRAREVSRGAVKGFTPKAYEDDVKKRLAEISNTTSRNKSATVTESPDEFSMMQALEGFVA